MKKGFFITLEGGEGTGKSEQVKFLKQWLEDHNLPYIATHEPGGTELGEAIRPILKHATYPICDRAELMLFNVARAQLIDEVIVPNLNNGVSIICDRFMDSTYAYQCKGRGMDEKSVDFIVKYATNQLEPDITFWLDLPPKDAFLRKNGADQTDRFEKNMELHEKVYDAFKTLNEKLPRFVRIDARGSIEEVSAQIEKHLLRLFNLGQ